MTKVQSVEAPVVSRDAIREIAFEVNGRRCVFKVRAPGDQTIPSLFLLGLPKAGSTLLGRLMRPVSEAAGLTYVAVQERLYDMGVAPRDIPPQVNGAFQPKGYAFGGFRSLPGALALPTYAAGRTALLIRDPRDMLTSLYFSVAYSHRAPGQRAGVALAASFDERRREASGMDIDAFVLANAHVVAGQYHNVEHKLIGIPHKLYRYEDVIFDKSGWVDDMAAYFGLRVPPSVVEEAVASHDVRPKVEDKTAHIRKVVPGDHVEKLTAATIAELNNELAPILRKYGYPDAP